MRLSVITEHRFERAPDGTVWTATANAYAFWARYLAVFDRVNVTARLRDVGAVPAAAVRADGRGVGSMQFARKDGTRINTASSSRMAARSARRIDI